MKNNREGVILIMKYILLGENDTIVYIESEDILISDTQSALDLMMTVKYDTDCSKIIIEKDVICEEFFRLSSGLAGDVLQKFINYHIKLAIVGDFTKYKSKPLHDLIYECNNGNDVYFVNNQEQAVIKLSMTR